MFLPQKADERLLVSSPKRSFSSESTPPKNDIELIKLRHHIWSKAIDTQRHFNQMSQQSRQLGLQFSVAALGFCAFMLTRDISFQVGAMQFHTLHATAIVLAECSGILT